jgi:hypothetical protein
MRVENSDNFRNDIVSAPVEDSINLLSLAFSSRADNASTTPSTDNSASRPSSGIPGLPDLLLTGQDQAATIPAEEQRAYPFPFYEKNATFREERLATADPMIGALLQSGQIEEAASVMIQHARAGNTNLHYLGAEQSGWRVDRHGFVSGTFRAREANGTESAYDFSYNGRTGAATATRVDLTVPANHASLAYPISMDALRAGLRRSGTLAPVER